jgi:LuxR family transcriptional regulator
MTTSPEPAAFSASGNIAAIAPAGHYLAIRVGFAYPILERNLLPSGWVAEYTARGFALKDPVMHWVYANTGACRWRDLAAQDIFGVLGAARRHGLGHGVAVSFRDDVRGERSFGSFARADREFTEDEMACLVAEVARLHRAHRPPEGLTPAEIEALGLVRDGYLMKEIAAFLGVGERAVKQRLKNAKTKLGAKTNSQAAAMAIGYRLI